MFYFVSLSLNSACPVFFFPPHHPGNTRDFLRVSSFCLRLTKMQRKQSHVV